MNSFKKYFLKTSLALSLLQGCSSIQQEIKPEEKIPQHHSYCEPTELAKKCTLGDFEGLFSRYDSQKNRVQCGTFYADYPRGHVCIPSTIEKDKQTITYKDSLIPEESEQSLENTCLSYTKFCSPAILRKAIQTRVQILLQEHCSVDASTILKNLKIGENDLVCEEKLDLKKY